MRSIYLTGFIATTVLYFLTGEFSYMSMLLQTNVCFLALAECKTVHTDPTLCFCLMHSIPLVTYSQATVTAAWAELGVENLWSRLPSCQVPLYFDA